MSDHSNQRDKIAERLKLAREQAGLSQNQVAKLLTWSRPTVSNLESAQRKLSSEEAISLAELYKVRLNWLLATTDDEEPAELGIAARELEKLKGRDFDVVLSLIKSLQKRKDEF